ncbi:MAG: TRAP transporter small permease [Alphaproteobacteria bacterium]|nr:TRAP transporter small permease [Alphaproteobacteria bacterium]
MTGRSSPLLPLPARLRDGLAAIDRVCGAAIETASCIALALAASVGFWQVLSRFLLSEPLDWSEVLTRVGVIWTVFLGLPAALRAGALLAVDFTRRHLAGTAGGRWLERLVGGLTLAVLVLLIDFGTQMAWRTRFQILAGLEVPISVVYAAIPFGAFFGVLALLARLAAPPSETREESLL